MNVPLPLYMNVSKLSQLDFGFFFILQRDSQLSVFKPSSPQVEKSGNLQNLGVATVSTQTASAAFAYCST